MKLYKLFLFIISISAAVVATAGNAAPVTLIVDTARPAQEILGFGASGAWWAQVIGGWPEAQRRAIIRLLYDKQTGLGLSIYRYNIGADTLSDTAITNTEYRAESLLDTKTGRYDWSRDANARRVMREAIEAGASEVILFANSPPVSMTKNGRGYGDKQPDDKKASNLAPERYADFAAYLGEVTEHLLHVDKMPVVALSPINEPEWDWAKPKQEGCYNTAAESAAILRAAYDEIKRRALPVRIEGPEGGSWESVIPYFEKITNDAELRAGMKDLCVHSYWTTTPQKQKLRVWIDANRPDIRLHMSEWCDIPDGLGTGMDGALPLARTAIEDFTLGRVNTWQYWRAASPYNLRGLVFYDTKTLQFAPSKRYWVFKQFTRYLEKGSVVLALKSSDKDAPAMAARLPDGRVAVICANLSVNAKTLDIKFSGNESWRQQLRVFTDDRNSNRESFASDVLPPHSVVTMIFQKQP